MILKNFNISLGLIFFFSLSMVLNAEEKIDIWKNKSKKTTSEIENDKVSPKEKKQFKLNNTKTINKTLSIEIQDGPLEDGEKTKVFGVYDPEENDFDLNMWSSTKAEDVRSSFRRIKKMSLSNFSNNLLENVLLSFSYPPEGMEQKEFTDLKINWLIENNRNDLMENFLNQNKEFFGKSRVVQHLVDESIAQADIKKGCEKIKFIDTSVKDSYLEKFKIYCLVFNNKKPQAQLLLDLLREQKQSDKFFDDKINYLLGISDKTSDKINEKNLLNFYLSSITIKDFSYQPTAKTKQEIWKYLNASNLIKLEDLSDKKKLKNLRRQPIKIKLMKI